MTVSTSSNTHNWTPQNCKTDLRLDKSYDISVWLRSFVAEHSFFDIYDTLLVFAFLWSFVVFVCFLNLLRTGVREKVEHFDIEEGSVES